MSEVPPMRLRHFKRYPAYKDSGVEWLGKIPALWDMKPLKHVTSFSTGWTPPTGREDLYGGEHLWANISDLGPKILLTTEKTISDGAIRQGRMPIAPSGSLLFSFKLSVGAVSLAGVDMYTNEAIASFHPSDRIDTDYLYWAAPVLVPRYAQDNIYGAPLLSRERIANALLPVPPLSEQRTIAALLDRETAKMDALVAKKERLIELLHEKRTALITRAVAKGLDPSVPMKDSGVEWLGAIPSGWDVFGAWRLISRIEQGWSPVAEDRRASRDEWAVIKLSAVSRGFFHENEHKALPAELVPETRYEISEGDVLLTRANTPELVGDVCVVPAVRPRLMLCDLVYRLQLWPERVVPKFLVYWLLSPSGRHRIEVEARGSSQSMVKVSQGMIRALPVVAPPVDEQRAIVAFLDEETAKLDALVERVRAAIDHLKELRTALISAAVTGKIDVREEVAGGPSP